MEMSSTVSPSFNLVKVPSQRNVGKTKDLVNQGIVVGNYVKKMWKICEKDVELGYPRVGRLSKDPLKRGPWNHPPHYTW